MKGFTLIEMLVAAAIFVIVMAAAYGLFDSSRRIEEETRFRSELLQEARTAFRRIREDLEGATTWTAAFDSGFIGTQGGGDDAPLCKLDFMSASHWPVAAGEEDVARVVYFIDEEAGTKVEGLVRRHVLPPVRVETVQRDEDLEELAPNAVYVKFRYYGDGTWVEVWDSTRSGRLPKAVEVTLHLRGIRRGGQEIEKFVERIHLPMASEAR